ncbi:ATPase AAA [Bacteroidia bacterium]|nr:ATPase AAA [Bacteroidia bacterium]
MEYKSRIIEGELAEKMQASGAVLIRGAKACGKTETAMHKSNSILRVDQDENVPLLLNSDPKLLIEGKTPRLIDEWQLQPKLWNYIRNEVDARKQAAQFILTGSATPKDDERLHSGAGRFTTVNMRTMSWQELGHSTGEVSLAKLFEGEAVAYNDFQLNLEIITERIIIGGFPALLDASVKKAILINEAYIDLIAEVDMSRVSNVKRDPVKVKNILKSLARNIATIADKKTLEKDLNEFENTEISRPTLNDYLDALTRLMIIEDQPAWNPHIRSSESLRKTPKHHLTDVSLAVAALGLDKKALLNDVKYLGFLFESMATHDLRVYAQANDAAVYYYRDSSELEVDAIVQKRNGDWAAFEIKLGIGQIDDAAKNLLKFASVVDTTKTKEPKSLNIITGTGMSYHRNDGINVISLAALGR